MSENFAEMTWDDSIESDGMQYQILPEGEYNFTVTGFERSRFPGSAKVPSCPKAVLTLTVDTPQGPATVRTDILLYRNFEWRISSFFRCIGQKKQGEKITMNWSKVLGSRGRAKIRPRTYTDKWNTQKEVNDVEYFIDYDPKFFTETENYGDDPIPF